MFSKIDTGIASTQRAAGSRSRAGGGRRRAFCIERHIVQDARGKGVEERATGDAVFQYGGEQPAIAAHAPKSVLDTVVGALAVRQCRCPVRVVALINTTPLGATCRRQVRRKAARCASWGILIR